jgi:putative membrane protein
MNRILTLASLILLAAAAPASPQDGAAVAPGTAAQPPAQSRAVLSAEDRSFATNAAESGLAQAQLGLLAENRAQNPDIQEFGRRMVTDHTRLDDELRLTAAAEGFSLPQQLPERYEALYQVLQRESGPLFDEEYLQDMVREHKAAIVLFERQVKSGTDMALKGFAEKALPLLQNHLKQAQFLIESSAVSGSSSGPGTTGAPPQ